MLRKSCFVFAGISLLILVLVGCNKTEVTQAEAIPNSYSTTMREEDIPTAESIQQLSEDVIYDRYTDAENIRFEDDECTDNINYLAFSYMNNQNPHYGFVVAEQDGDQLKLAWFEDFPIFHEKPISVVKWSGSCPGTEDRVIYITAGYVNDETIEEIILYYSGSITKVIKLGEEQKVFFDINLDPDAYLLKFEAKSSKGRIVYKEEYMRSETKQATRLRTTIVPIERGTCHNEGNRQANLLSVIGDMALLCFIQRVQFLCISG